MRDLKVSTILILNYRMSYSPFIIANPYFTWTLSTHLPNKCIVLADTRLPNSISTLLFSAKAVEPRSNTLVLIRKQAIDCLPSSLDTWQAAISWTYQLVYYKSEEAVGLGKYGGDRLPLQANKLYSKPFVHANN